MKIHSHADAHDLDDEGSVPSLRLAIGHALDKPHNRVGKEQKQVADMGEGAQNAAVHGVERRDRGSGEPGRAVRGCVRFV
ncbi:MAG: hypothetical protein KF705_03870 [Phycisphaeraceae bacterium]|nr:hypothetical protein [Phycisphaeraceae bacterium]